MRHPSLVPFEARLVLSIFFAVGAACSSTSSAAKDAGDAAGPGAGGVMGAAGGGGTGGQGGAPGGPDALAATDVTVAEADARPFRRCTRHADCLNDEVCVTLTSCGNDSFCRLLPKECLDKGQRGCACDTQKLLCRQAYCLDHPTGCIACLSPS